MSSPPTLRVYRDEGLELPAYRAAAMVRDATRHPFLAVVFSAAIHLLVLAGASLAAAIAVSKGASSSPAVPAHPVHTVFVALILAQCGLVSVFCARSLRPLSLKVGVSLLILLCLWLLLVGTMETTNESPVAAGAWAVGLLLEAVIVWLCVTAAELVLHYESAVSCARFGLLQLLIGTTAIAAVFGAGRVVAARYGFALADVPEWNFFWHVQFAAIMNAALAVGLYASLRLPSSWWKRVAFCTSVILAFAVAAPLIFLATFSQNASLTEMRWLFGSEGLFLIATLVPMQVLHEYAHMSK